MGGDLSDRGSAALGLENLLVTLQEMDGSQWAVFQQRLELACRGFGPASQKPVTRLLQ